MNEDTLAAFQEKAIPRSGDTILKQRKMMVELTPVESSMIAAVGYEPEDRTLVVLFNNGRAYEYYQVPLEDYQGLMEADSKGQFVNSRIKGVYSFSPFRGWKKKSE